MPPHKELGRDQRMKSKELIYNDAVTSAVGSIAAHFLRENKAKGRPLKDLSRGVIIYPDGTEEKIEEPASNGKPEAR